MRSIVLGTISLDKMAGGLEKNIVLLANHLARQGNDVSLITFDSKSATSFYSINPLVTWHKVANTKPHSPISFWERLKLIGRIRSTLKEMNNPIVICFHHGILPRFLLAAIVLRLRFICSERNSLSLYRHIRQSKWSLGFMAMVLVNRITVQFPNYVLDYPFWLRRRIKVIHNPVFMPTDRASPDEVVNNGRYKIITVGRLCAQKNFITLIEAFKDVSNEFSLWDLHIIGSGEAHYELIDLINSLELSNRVFLEGKKDDVPSWLSGANIFCLPSKWEGFPNALAEAMAHGLPCIGFKECAGVRDLIGNGHAGILAEQGALHEALYTLMASAEKRKKMGLASVEIISQYSPTQTFEKWDALLEQTAKQK